MRAERDQTGSGGLGVFGAIAMVIVIVATARWLFGIDLIGYLDLAADWLANMLDKADQRR